MLYWHTQRYGLVGIIDIKQRFVVENNINRYNKFITILFIMFILLLMNSVY